MKIQVLKNNEAIFAKEMTTEYVELSNYKEVNFALACGKGIAGKTILTVLAKEGAAGSAKAIPFTIKNGDAEESVTADGREINLGGETSTAITIVVYAKDLSDSDRVAINTKAIALSILVGTVVSASANPRYSE